MNPQSIPPIKVAALDTMIDIKPSILVPQVCCNKKRFKILLCASCRQISLVDIHFVQHTRPIYGQEEVVSTLTAYR